MEEARLNQLKEMNGEDRTPQIKKFNQAELLHPDYIPPATKEEALARIGELDAKYGPEIQYLDRREMVKNFRAQDLSTICLLYTSHLSLWRMPSSLSCVMALASKLPGMVSTASLGSTTSGW